MNRKLIEKISINNIQFIERINKIQNLLVNLTKKSSICDVNKTNLRWENIKTVLGASFDQEQALTGKCHKETV